MEESDPNKGLRTIVVHGFLALCVFGLALLGDVELGGAFAYAIGTFVFLILVVPV